MSSFLKRQGELGTPFFLLILCFFLSGFAGLIYQSVWSQEFALVFGTSELALVTVLAAYMAGLAGGAALVGRAQLVIKRPVLVYAILELAIAVTACAVPFAIKLAAELQVILLGGSDLAGAHGLGLLLFDLIASFLILMIPTGLMGATLPLLAQHVVRTDQHIGSRIGILYTVNTLGAAAGALTAAYLFLPNLGLGKTVWIAVAANVAVFGAAYLLAKKAPTIPPPADTSDQVAPQGSALILGLMALSGAISFTLEILWTRLLAQILGGTVYAFGIMLSTFLLGIALGSAIASRLATHTHRAWRWYAATQFGVGIFTLLAFLFADSLPALVSRWGNSFGSLLFTGSLLCSFTLLPAAICSGATFPLAVRIFARDSADSRRASAQVFAWNTLGAILGAIFAGFIVIPALAFHGTVALTTCLSGLLATIALLHLSRQHRYYWPGSFAFGLVITGAVLLFLNPLPQPLRLLRASALNLNPPPAEIAYFSVGRSANVMVSKLNHNWRLSTNGLPESMIQMPGSRPSDLSVARWLSMLPLAARPNIDSMLVIGFGAGVTVEEIPAHVDSIQVVELEPEVIRANQFMADRRKTDPLADPRLTIHVNDARSALHLADQRFDAIISQPSHPWTSGASHLFTKEFFQLVRSRLEEDGVFVQWIGRQFVDLALLKSLIATLNHVFDHVEVYAPDNRSSVLFMASMTPLLTADSIAESLEKSEKAWSEIWVNRPEDIWVARLLTGKGSRVISQGAPISSDYHNLLKIHSPKVLMQGVTGPQLDELILQNDALIEDLDQEERLTSLSRLLLRNHKSRARNLAFHIQEASQRKIANSMLALVEGSQELGLRGLLDALHQNPGHAIIEQSIFDHLTHPQPSFIDALHKLPLSTAGKVILESIEARNKEDWETLRHLDEALGSVPIKHPLSREALTLRIQWRLAKGSAAELQQAAQLLNQLMRFPLRNDAKFLRAEIYLKLKNQVEAQAAVNAIFNLVKNQRGHRTKPLHQKIMRRMRRMFQELPPDSKSWAKQQFPNAFTDFAIRDAAFNDNDPL